MQADPDPLAAVTDPIRRAVAALDEALYWLRTERPASGSDLDQRLDRLRYATVAGRRILSDALEGRWDAFE